MAGTGLHDRAWRVRRELMRRGFRAGGSRLGLGVLALGLAAGGAYLWSCGERSDPLTVSPQTHRPAEAGEATDRGLTVEASTLVEHMPNVRDLVADADHVYFCTYLSREAGDEEEVSEGRLMRVALTEGAEPELVVLDEDAPEMVAFAGDGLAFYSRGPTSSEPRPSHLKRVARVGGDARVVWRGSIQVGGGFTADARRAWFSEGRELVEVALANGTRRVIADLGRGYAKELAATDHTLFVLEERYPEEVRADRSALVRVDLTTGARRDLLATEAGTHLRGFAVSDDALYTTLNRETAGGRVDPSFGRLLAIPREGGDVRTLVEADELLGGVVTDGRGVYFVRRRSVERYDLARDTVDTFVTEPSRRPTRLTIAGDRLVWLAGPTLRAAPLPRD